MHQNSNSFPSEAFNLVCCDEVDSTNDELRRILLKEGTSVNQGVLQAVMAKRQTGGKGRLGRNWVSPPGGLYLSFALELQEPTHEESALSLIMALCAHEQLVGYLGRERAHQQNLQIKWPNDLICEQGKLVGILVELAQIPLQGQSQKSFLKQPDGSSGKQIQEILSLPNSATTKRQASKRTAIVGIGVNVNRPAGDAGETSAYLSDLIDETPSLEHLAKGIIESVLANYSRWQQAHNSFAPFREEYNASLATRGKQVTVRDSMATILAEGTVLGVDASGCLLVVDTEGRQKKVFAGEVTLRA